MGIVRPCKVVAFEGLLNAGRVSVLIYPKADGVRIPQWLRFKDHVALEIGLNMRIPISDLAVDRTGISCTLSFKHSGNRSSHHCVMPWRSIFGMLGEGGRGIVWYDDMPARLVAEVSAERAAVDSSPRDTRPLHLV